MLIHPYVQASNVLLALQQALPLNCIETAIANSGSQQQRIQEELFFLKQRLADDRVHL